MSNGKDMIAHLIAGSRPYKMSKHFPPYNNSLK